MSGAPMLPLDIQERPRPIRFWRGVFMRRIAPRVRIVGECWITDMVARLDGGYVGVRVGLKEHRLHRIAFMAFHGAIPAGLHIPHSCDIGACCNPEHLRAGTPQDNADDQRARNRPQRGWGSSSRKRRLRPVEVIAIRGSGETRHQLAKKFRVSPQTISLVKRNRIWKDVV